ncbi:iron permease [Trametes cingulata]|nr:iron permease [Trametes cingulata]
MSSHSLTDSTVLSQNELVPKRQPKSSLFWLTFLSILVCIFLTALDLTAVPTALPTITNDLHGGDKFIWIGSAYGLASSAVLLLSGRLADIFGRKPVLLTSIAVFASGSAVAGASQNMGMLIAARVVQGVAGGSLLNVSEIVISDLVPLAERGIYQGMIVLAYAVASGVGPVIGASLSQNASWRWLFYLNLPLTGLAFALVSTFLRVRSPRGSICHKLLRVDWIGNSLMAAGSTLALLGLTWGGIQYPWDSAHVLAPLAIGFVIMAAFFVYEIYVPEELTLPLEVIANRTSVAGCAKSPLCAVLLRANRIYECGFLATFVHGITSIAAIYYLPTYFQACFVASPLRSSVQTLPTALVMPPFSLLCGFVVKATRTYRPINVVGWILSIIGFGLLSLLQADSAAPQWIGFQFLMSAGTGIIYASTVFAVLAPLPVSRNAAALGFFMFCRTFAQTWGITISGTILQNQLKSQLPPAFTAQFPSGVEIAYAAIPLIPTLDEPLRTEVREAFAGSMTIIWKTMVGLCGAGILTLFLLKEVPMVTHTDEAYGLREDLRSSATDAASVQVGISKSA